MIDLQNCFTVHILTNIHTSINTNINTNVNINIDTININTDTHINNNVNMCNDVTVTPPLLRIRPLFKRAQMLHKKENTP